MGSGVSMNWIFLVGTAIANLCMGAYVFSRAPKAPLNKAFALLSFSTALWSAALAVGYHAELSGGSPESTTLVIRCAFAAGSLFAIAFLLFIERFTLPDHRTSFVVRFVLVPFGATFFVLSFSSWIVVSARSHAGGLQVIYGHTHPLFALYALVGLAATLYMLVGKYRRSDGLEGLQVR